MPLASKQYLRRSYTTELNPDRATLATPTLTAHVSHLRPIEEGIHHALTTGGL
jgi:hypothetical protein